MNLTFLGLILNFIGAFWLIIETIIGKRYNRSLGGTGKNKYTEWYKKRLIVTGFPHQMAREIMALVLITEGFFLQIVNMF